MTKQQKRRVEKMAEHHGRVDVSEIPADSVFAVAYNAKGEITWFEIVDPEATMLHAWDTGAPRD